MPNKYRQPPISQVFCEFLFSPTIDWDITLAGLLFQELRADYPNKQRAFVPSAAGEPLNIGDTIQFHREDGSSYVQLGPNSLAINVSAGYPGWEEYLPQIERVLDSHQKIAQPADLQRIGLRYVNHVIVPETQVFLEDWFHYYIHTASATPAMVQFVAFSQFLHQDERDILGLQLASAGVDGSNNAVILLDIDYSLLKPRSVPYDHVASWLTEAHETIEARFEATITDRLRESFQLYE